MNPSEGPIRVLLVEDNPGDAALLCGSLEAAYPGRYEVKRVASLRAAKAALAGEGDLPGASESGGVCSAEKKRGQAHFSKKGSENEPVPFFSAVLLDLSLPDSQGVGTVDAAMAAAGPVPIIVLTGLDDEATGVEAVRRGAQDYLVKGQTTADLLARSIRHAVERKAAQLALQRARGDLERKVAERTADLRRTVGQLQAEVVRRQRAEAELKQAYRVSQMVSASNQAVVRKESESDLVAEVCRIAVEVGGYRMAWVGYAVDDAGRSVRPIGATGFEAGYLESARISWADVERGRGPTGTAIRSGRPVIGTDFLTDPELAPWREQAIKRGFRSSVALPLSFEDQAASAGGPAGGVFGALTIYAAEPAAFDQAQVRVLGELADDLSFGIMAVRTRTALRESRLELAAVNESLAQRANQLRGLASELTLAEQRERRRLAHVLHDHIQQLMVGAKYRIALLGRCGGRAMGRAIRELDELVSESIEASRSLTVELSPPVLHEAGLTAALEWLGRWMKEKHGLTVAVRADASADPAEEDVRVLLFESVRELLFNVVKHARVKAARVAMERRDHQVRIVVEDRGAGFDPAGLNGEGAKAGGFGLFSIRERLGLLGGSMDIRSDPGHGSRFTLAAPLGGAIGGPAKDLPAASKPARRSGQAGPGRRSGKAGAERATQAESAARGGRRRAH